jgi:hypothetical protein
MADEQIPSSQQQTEVDTNRDDEGYQDSAGSSLFSLLSDIRRGKFENGRLFANFGAHEYALPIDEDELNRLDLNHAKYHLMYGKKDFLSPIGDNPQKILDVGCGTGM